jgi:hypothetical protein
MLLLPPSLPSPHDTTDGRSFPLVGG